MSFLTLNSTPIRCRKDACDVKHAEHRLDRARAFDGTVRVTRGGIFREFTVVTGLLDDTDYAAYKALIETDTPPLTAAGDWVGGTIKVYPVPGSWTPLVTRAETTGFRRQAKFTLLESPTISEPDTSAEPWAFYRRGVGFWQERAASTPAMDGDQVDRWDDQSGNERHLVSHDGNGAGPDGTAWAGSLDYRPIRDTGQNALRFGDTPNEMRPNEPMDALTELEMLVGVRAFEASPSARYVLLSTREAVSGCFYPHTDGHIYESFGLPSQYDAGLPTPDISGYNCYNPSGSTVGAVMTVRLNLTTMFTHALGMAEGFLWDHNSGSDLGISISGDADHPFIGWVRDIVIFDAILTDSQRLAWTNYIRGVTSTPPL